MKVGDLVEYKTWRAIITEKVNLAAHAPDFFLYTLHFLGNPPEFLKRGPDGYFSGFQCWELELLSTGQPDESW